MSGNTPDNGVKRSRPGSNKKPSTTTSRSTSTKEFKKKQPGNYILIYKAPKKDKNDRWHYRKSASFNFFDFIPEGCTYIYFICTYMSQILWNFQMKIQYVNENMYFV